VHSHQTDAERGFLLVSELSKLVLLELWRTICGTNDTYQDLGPIDEPYEERL
jgi:hypothetical protein